MKRNAIKLLRRSRLKNLYKKLSSDHFIRQVSILTVGTIGARAILALSLPILTRLYSPEDFELLAVYMAILSVVTVVANLRLNMAIPLPSNDREAVNLLVLSLFASSAISAILVIPIIINPELTARHLGQPKLLPFLWLIPLGVLLASSYQALQYWTTRKQRFKLIAQTRITRAIGGVSTQLSFGLVSASHFGLLMGHMIYNGFGLIGLTRDILRNDREFFSAVSIRNLMHVLSVYRRFPFFSVPEALANSSATQIPIILIAAVAIGPEAGYLALAMQVMTIPMALVGKSVAQVFISEAPSRLRSGTLSCFTRKTSITLLKIGTVFLIPIGILAPFAFGPVFGNEWARAGEILLWMTPWHILQFASSPISTVLHVTGHLRLAMVLQIFGALSRIGSVVVTAIFAPELTLVAYIVSSSVFYAVYIAVVLGVTRFSQSVGPSPSKFCQ